MLLNYKYKKHNVHLKQLEKRKLNQSLKIWLFDDTAHMFARCSISCNINNYFSQEYGWAQDIPASLLFKYLPKE